METKSDEEAVQWVPVTSVDQLRRGMAVQVDSPLGWRGAIVITIAEHGRWNPAIEESPRLACCLSFDFPEEQRHFTEWQLLSALRVRKPGSDRGSGIG
jgi:hypothetical protein